VIIGTAGHIDHGKTALVCALTGVDTDRLPEEKRRGITIDLGFAPLMLDGVGTVGIVDVPGHEDFVRSMLVGASGIDLGLLVVAADAGVMPQTREHLRILELLGIPRIVVALTKSDLVDSEWLALVESDVDALVREGKVDLASIVACSSRTGAGLDRLRVSLSEALLTARPRPKDDLFRLPVDRAFSVRGTGTVVTGTVWSGELRADSNVRVLPTGLTARVRRIEQHGASSDRAAAGARAAIALAGLDVADIPRGSVIVTDERWLPTSSFEAVVTIDAELARSLSSRAEWRLHAGASDVGARLVFESSADPAATRLVRVRTDAPLMLRGGDRFVLRLPAPLRTVGGGIVVDPRARRRPLPRLDAEQARRLAEEPAERLRFIVSAEELAGVPIAEIPVRAGCTPAEVEQLIERIDGRRTAHNLFAPEAVEHVMATVQRIVAEYEIRSPLGTGVPARTLKEGLRANEELSDLAIGQMARSGKLEIDGPAIRRKGWLPSPTTSDVDVTNRLAHDICAGDREPPSVSELISRYGNSVPALLHFLERQGRIVQVETERYYDRGVVQSLITRLTGQLVPGRVYVPAQLRDVLGFSRKYLIPFLEFCDRIGVTERRSEGRALRQTSDNLLDSSRAQS
jgi:selenocysteine-specific elongation factor